MYDQLVPEYSKKKSLPSGAGPQRARRPARTPTSLTPRKPRRRSAQHQILSRRSHISHPVTRRLSRPRSPLSAAPTRLSRVGAHAPAQRLPDLRRRRNLHSYRDALHDEGDVLTRRPRRLALELCMRQPV